MQNDKNQLRASSLATSWFLLFYSAKHATELKRSESEVGHCGVVLVSAKHATEMERSGIEVGIALLKKLFKKQKKCLHFPFLCYILSLVLMSYTVKK